MAKAPKKSKPVEVTALKHEAAKRKNIPTAEFESIMREEDKSPVQIAYGRRNRDLDPQLVWRGKDEQDWSDLIVQAPPLYIQEKVHPKVLIEDLKRETKTRRKEELGAQVDMFADFNGIKDKEAETEFYQHDKHWANRMILGDSLSVMASLAEREGLRGQVQCIYFDPPYGIKFNSNFQWSTTSRDVKDGKKDSITREPEQVKAFRDTWRDGIHSYLTYLRDRLTVARDLLSDSGSIFVQIGDENAHRVRSLLDEIFGDENFVSEISFRKTTTSTANLIENVGDIIIWYSKGKAPKFRRLYAPKNEGGLGGSAYKAATAEEESFTTSDLTSQNPGSRYDVKHEGKIYRAEPGWWKTEESKIYRLQMAGRLAKTSNKIRYKRLLSDFSVFSVSNFWNDTAGEVIKTYVVQTATEVVKRCILMATDPGDLVLDPTCGSGTTAYVAEQWGRRWITIDTSRVSLALARSRIMGARYPFYLLADSIEGQYKEGEITRLPPKTALTHGDIRHGFVYERVPHITLKSIANNAEIDVIWDKWQQTLEPLRQKLNKMLSKNWQEWEIPRDITDIVGAEGGFQKVVLALGTPSEARRVHAEWWEARVARQKEIDLSIAAKAEFEYLYDKPCADNSKVRVAGPFTVETLSPHRTLAVDWDDELIDTLEASEGKRKAADRDQNVLDFAQMILENLKAAGVQQANKEDKIAFTSLVGWPGHFICAEGKFMEGDKEKRAGVLIGPEFGTVSRPDLVAAAREAGDAKFDVLIACAFNFDALSTEFDKLGRVPVLKARMNPDLHMGADLKTTASANLFVVFGEPDIAIEKVEDDQIRVKIQGVDVFKPQTGEIVSEGPDGIALWMVDTDYNEESFFVRHAYFLGANDPYKALKTTLKTEIDKEAWETLYSDTSRPFPKPKSGRIAVKVINHLGDEVMKVYSTD